MKKSKNIFDFKFFEKIEDIIFLDEPILTHFKRNEKHFLLYLVDTLEGYDNYIMLDVEEEIIFKYLTKRISLRNLILENKNIGFFIQQDFNGKVLEVNPIESNVIDDNYLPLEDSYLEYKPSKKSYYYNFIKEFESKLYLAGLRQNAFYVKFASNSSKYSDTIGLNELATDLLSNLSKSFKSFLKADYFEVFKEIQTDQVKLQKTFNKLLPDLDLRMVDLNFSSFEVGLAVDKLMKGSIENREVKEWAVTVGYKYKDIVLDDDYDDETVNYILNSYDEEDRKKIFNPIFKITENPNFSLQIKNSKKGKYSTIRIKDKSIIDKIIPKSSETVKVDDSKDYQIVQVTTLIDKNKSKSTIKLENTLFSSMDNTDVVLTNVDFKKYGYEVENDISIPLNIKAEKDTIILTALYDNEEFQVVYHSDKIADGMEKITSNIFEYILNKFQ